MSKQKLTMKRSYRDGMIGVGVFSKANEYGSDTIRIDATLDVDISDARAFAAALVAEADRLEDVAAKRAAAKDRRMKWREREIAAGRIRLMSIDQLLSR